jgi:hypothetical protein
MDYWPAYDWIVNTIHTFMVKNEECLYNALVLTFGEKSNDSLIRIRESLRDLIQMIDEELVTREDIAGEENEIDE